MLQPLAEKTGACDRLKGGPKRRRTIIKMKATEGEASAAVKGEKNCLGR